MKFNTKYLFFPGLIVILSVSMWYLVGCNLSTTGMALTSGFGKEISGTTIETRYTMEPGFTRMECKENSFGAYLRQLKLKPNGTAVTYYNGEKKSSVGVYDAVVDLPIGKKDLHQCADAVMRLRAEFLFHQKRYDDIHFNFTNGFKAEYAKWRKGYRVQVNGNKVNWVKSSQPSDSYDVFWSYLEKVFTYAGTLSLSKELKAVRLSQMQIGDVFIKGGTPGHAVIVMDMMQNQKTGNKYFMLAQSYMPAQETQILLNPLSRETTVWYLLDTGLTTLVTPEWKFDATQLKRFQ